MFLVWRESAKQGRQLGWTEIFLPTPGPREQKSHATRRYFRRKGKNEKVGPATLFLQVTGDLSESENQKK